MSTPPLRGGHAAPAPPAPPRPSGPPPARVGRKERVNVSLPVGLSRGLVERSEADQRYLTDMVVEAVYELGHLVATEGRSRKRRPSGRITHMLYVTAGELLDIDEMAAGRGMSRSGFVAAVLERWLEP